MDGPLGAMDEGRRETGCIDVPELVARDRPDMDGVVTACKWQPHLGMPL